MTETAQQSSSAVSNSKTLTKKIPTTTMNDSEYKSRLRTKITCLIAVLDVALAKIQRSMELPGTDPARMKKIAGNLENTRTICERALKTLDGVTPAQEQKIFNEEPEPQRMGMREYIELTSIDEYNKFKNLPPISADEVASVDINKLVEEL